MGYYRSLTEKILGGLSKSPALLLVGARQTGKSFLVKELAKMRPAHYLSFDNLTTLSSAHYDPIGFLKSAPRPLVLDEIQRAPELFLPIKEEIDHNRVPGSFMLTGSANPLMVPQLGDSLAGRMLLYELYPLSQGEIEQSEEVFLDKIFLSEPSFSKDYSCSKLELIERVGRGGYPEAQRLTTYNDRGEWVDAYLSLIIQKDVQDLARIEGITQLPNLLIALSSQVGSLLDYASLSRATGLPMTTLRRYFQLLHSLYLVHTLPAYSRNLSKRVMKSPKVYFVDTLPLLRLLNLDPNRLKGEPKLLGGIIENFVVLELIKQKSWSQKRVGAFHFRTDAHQEVDLVLEDELGKVVGIEIKSSETVTAGDFAHLKAFREIVGGDYLRGVVLYAGNQTLSFGPDLLALPISSLWQK